MPTAPKWVNDAFETLASSMMRTVEVVGTTTITPQLKKIRFQGDFKTLRFEIGYSISFRINAKDTRHYTVSYGNCEEGILEVIAHIHGNAPGSNFMKQLKPGDVVKMAIPFGPKQYDPEIKKQLIFGDETSLSLMLAFLPVLQQNKHQYQFYIELNEENISVPKILGLDNYTVFSKHEVFRNKEKIRELPIFKNGDWKNANIVLTGNINSLQNFRKVFKEHNHKGKPFVKGFWLEGKKGL
ncbi:FAD-binding oxidoreductase [Fulvivirga sediminis]|uniref:FAD-binding FR-type domain-containing protein n=1 Tax=Fulvivirga sediminis TaxID=2803949 RepID=A0A937K0F1_9BACT|nr:FAD-binding oxidoreductase [Fulvivirga sediminis]MBL3658298.1 hypothetical protein [Fulvivirga sediminis]